MQVTPKSRLIVKLQNILFIVLFLTVIGILAWLSTRYVYQADWTASGRNTLSSVSQTMLGRMKGPIDIVAYARTGGDTRDEVRDLIARYQLYKPDVSLSFTNPDTEPELVRKLDITTDGELIINYQGNNEHVTQLTEQEITNALQRVTRKNKPKIVFVEGHGERNPTGSAGHDLNAWVRQFQSKGLLVETINLVAKSQIPNDTRVLVIAGPQTDLFPGEINLIYQYVNNGGNLLWLRDPGPDYALGLIAEQLGIEFIPGTIVDPSAQLYGINRPEFTVVAQYNANPIVRGFDVVTLFPTAGAMTFRAPPQWRAEEFLVSLATSWSEAQALDGNISMDRRSGDIPGPLNIGVAMVRDTPEGTAEQKSALDQRVVVAGDGDFLSNAFLGQGGNLDLGMKIINWLAHEDTFIPISARTAPDTSLNLSPVASGAIGLGFLIVLPVILLGTGVMIWRRRRKR